MFFLISFLKNILETHGYKLQLQTGLPHFFSKIHVQLTPAYCLPSATAVFTHDLWLRDGTVIAETLTSRVSGWFMTPLTMNTASAGGHPASQRCGRSTGVSLGAVNSNRYGLSKQNCWLSTAWRLGEQHDKKQKEQKVGWRSSGCHLCLPPPHQGCAKALWGQFRAWRCSWALPPAYTGAHAQAQQPAGQVWIWTFGLNSLEVCPQVHVGLHLGVQEGFLNQPSPKRHITSDQQQSAYCQPTAPASLLTLLTPYHFQKPENLLKVFISHFLLLFVF